MRNLNDTIARLTALRQRNAGAAWAPANDRLSELADFGGNPGALRALEFLPDNLPEAAPLVVVLHGCTQTAAGYDAGAGWSQLAEEAGFALLFPEQSRANNANLCFNWFQSADIARDSGEALSIRQMIETMLVRHGLDRSRVFITGLSAGGAMTASMLAAYPEIFAGGAVIAGLPHGVASSVPEAFDRMRGHGLPSSATLQQLLRSASSHRGPWPRLSIWHGDSDQTVSPANGEAVVQQWLGVHGAGEEPSVTENIDGHRRRTWLDPKGGPAIEAYTIAGLGHGTPLDTVGPGALGAAAPFMLEAGISSTRRIARFWGIAAEPAERALPAARTPAIASPAQKTSKPQPAGPGAVIEAALRKAGLM